MKQYFLVLLITWLIPISLYLIWLAAYRRRHPPPSQEVLATAKLLLDRRWLPSGWVGMVSTFVYIIVYSVRTYVPMPGAGKFALLAAPVIVFAWFIRTFIREVREGDELARSVHLEALTMTFSSFLFFAAGMWLMREIDVAPRHGTYDLSLGFLPIFYFVGLYGAKARYMPTTRPDHENR
jgi:hypothetical protein